MGRATFFRKSRSFHKPQTCSGCPARYPHSHPAVAVRSSRHTSPGRHADSTRCVKSCLLSSACSAEMVIALPAARNSASRWTCTPHAWRRLQGVPGSWSQFFPSSEYHTSLRLPSVATSSRWSAIPGARPTPKASRPTPRCRDRSAPARAPRLRPNDRSTRDRLPTTTHRCGRAAT